MREQILYDLCRNSPPELLQKVRQAYEHLYRNYPNGAQTKLFTLLWEYVGEDSFDGQAFRTEADELLGSSAKRYKTLAKLYDTCLLQFDAKRHHQLTTADHLNRLNLFLCIRSVTGAEEELKAIEKCVEQESNFYLRLHALSQKFRVRMHFGERHLEEAYENTAQELRQLFPQQGDAEFQLVLDYYAFQTLGFKTGSNPERRKRILRSYQAPPGPIPAFSGLDAQMMYVRLHARVAKEEKNFPRALAWLELGLAHYETHQDPEQALVRWDLVLVTDKVQALYEAKRPDEFLRVLTYFHERAEKASYYYRYQGLNTYYFQSIMYLIQTFQSRPLTPEAKQKLARIQARYQEDMKYFGDRRRLSCIFTLCVLFFVRREYVDFERYYWVLTRDKHVSKDHHRPHVRTAELMYLSMLIEKQFEIRHIHSLADRIQHQLEPWEYSDTERLIFRYLKQVYKAPLGDRKAIWKTLHRKLKERLPADGSYSSDHNLMIFAVWLDNRFSGARGARTSAAPA